MPKAHIWTTTLIATLSVAVCGVHAKPAGLSAQKHTSAGLLAFEDSLFHADVDRDVATVQRGYASDAIFVHANGMIETKDAYVQAMRVRTPPSSVEGRDRDVRVLGDAGIVRGTKEVTIGQLRLSGTYLTAYIWRDGGWVMLWSQSSPDYKPRAIGQ